MTTQEKTIKAIRSAGKVYQRAESKTGICRNGHVLRRKFTGLGAEAVTSGIITRAEWDAIAKEYTR